MPEGRRSGGSSPRRSERIWLIGASEGIGEALARAYAARGDALILSARTVERLHALADTLPGSHDVLPLDIGDSQSMGQAQLAMRAMGPVDRVINMAALYDPGQVEELDNQRAADIVQVNLMGAFMVARTALSVLRPAGQLALCGSVAGYFGLPQGQIYSATKAGVTNLAESLRIELSGRFDVRLLSPGFVDTRLTQKNAFAMPGLMTPENAAQAIVRGLDRRPFEVHFPRRLTLPLKLLRILPYALAFPLTRRLLR